MGLGSLESDKRPVTFLTTVFYNSLGEDTSMYSLLSLKVNPKYLNDEESRYDCELQHHCLCDSDILLALNSRVKNFFCTVLTTVLGILPGMW